MPDLNKEEFKAALDSLKAELSKLRTGRAQPALVEDVRVDYYGTPTAVKQLGNISVPEPRQLLIQPWDKNALSPMEKAIREAGLGLNPTNEGDKLRITIPTLTEERRKELLKIAGKLAEEARIRVRAAREEISRDIKKRETGGAISEDDRFREQEQLQKVVDEFNAQIKDILEAKEKEMMTI